MICLRCNKARQPRDRIEHDKNGKAWLIEYCHHCNYNFDLTEWSAQTLEIREDGQKKLEEDVKRVKAKRKGSWFRSQLNPDPDEDR